MDASLFHQIEGQGRNCWEGKRKRLKNAGVSHSDIWEEHPGAGKARAKACAHIVCEQTVIQYG